MPVHSDTNGMGAQMPTEKYGVRSPFHAGGGGGGGGGSGAATQVLDGGSNTVPDPHSAALLTPGETTVTRVSGANAAAAIIAKRGSLPTIAGFPSDPPRPCSGTLRPAGYGFPRIDDCENPHGGGPTAMRDGQTCGCASGLNAVSIARHIVRKQMPSCRPAPTVCAGKCCTARWCLALRSPTCSYSEHYSPGSSPVFSRGGGSVGVASE